MRLKVSRNKSGLQARNNTHTIEAELLTIALAPRISANMGGDNVAG
jgi:hypothetical protein